MTICSPLEGSEDHASHPIVAGTWSKTKHLLSVDWMRGDWACWIWYMLRYTALGSVLASLYISQGRHLCDCIHVPPTCMYVEVKCDEDMQVAAGGALRASMLACMSRRPAFDSDETASGLAAYHHTRAATLPGPLCLGYSGHHRSLNTRESLAEHL